MKHYVYRISNIIANKHYYGTRSSQHPKLDLGIIYFSSSSDIMFIKEQKQTPENFKYKILKIFENREQAIEYEILLHNKFDVGANLNFYNRAKQTSIGFDRTGIPRTKKFKENNSIIHKNKIVTQATRNKLSTAVKKLWEDKNYIQKQNLSRPACTGLLNNNFKPVTIFDNNNEPILTVLYKLTETLDDLGYPGTSFQQSLYRNKPLFQSLRNSDIQKIKNKGVYHFKGWYAMHCLDC